MLVNDKGMGKYTRLSKNTALVFLGSTSKLINLLMLPLYTRWLTVDEYGSVDLIVVYSSLLLGIISCSLFDAIFIFPKDHPYEKKCEYFSSGMGFSLMTITGMSIVCGLLQILSRINEWHGFRVYSNKANSIITVYLWNFCFIKKGF